MKRSNSTGVHVAFDLGAESGRTVVGRFDGETLSAETVHRFPTRSVRLPDGLRWDAAGHFAEITSSLAQLHAAGEHVGSIGIDAWGVDFGLLDAAGSLVGNPRHHRDATSDAALATAFARVPRAEIYAATGIQFLPFNTLFQLIALEGSVELERARTLLLLPDLFAYWLTGEQRAEVTNASTTQLLDVGAGDWAWDLLERLEIRAGLFAPVVEAGTILGGLLAGVADSTGLATTTPVVAVASHDTASAVVAVPARSDSSAYISSGTWSLVGVERDEPVLTKAALDANLTNERGFGGSIRLLKNVMGLWLVQECRRAWSADGIGLDYADVSDIAASAPAGGPLFDPDSPELLAPGDMPGRIRAACERTGRPAPQEPAEVIRAIFESLACKYRLVLDEIESVTGTAIETVHVIGGGARNAFLCQLTANVSGRAVLARPAEAAAFGSLLVQLHALGELGSLADMREVVRRSTAIQTYEPDGDPRWEALYARFQNVLTQLPTREAAAL